MKRNHIICETPLAGSVDAELMTIAADCARAPGISDRWDMIRAYWQAQGLSKPFYMYMDPSKPSDRAIVLAQMPQWWADFYLESDAAARDPFFKTCYSLTPRLTGVNFLPENRHMLEQSEIDFVHEASDTGLTSGFAQPVRTAGQGHFGGWHLGSDLDRPAFEQLVAENAQRWQLASFLFHQVLQDAAETGQINRGPSLTPRERECLTWLASGLRTGQIADRLGLANVTVDMHVASARRKLGAATREQAVALAITKGLVAL